MTVIFLSPGRESFTALETATRDTLGARKMVQGQIKKPNTRQGSASRYVVFLIFSNYYPSRFESIVTNVMSSNDSSGQKKAPRQITPKKPTLAKQAKVTKVCQQHLAVFSFNLPISATRCQCISTITYDRFSLYFLETHFRCGAENGTATRVQGWTS